MPKKLPDLKRVLRKAEGITLVELLVVIGMITIITAIVWMNYRVFGTDLALERSANRMAQDIRQTLELAVSSRIPPGYDIGGLGEYDGGYGIHFVEGTRNYFIFADLNNDRIYTAGEKVEDEDISIESGILISGVDLFGGINCEPSVEPSVVFRPPDPAVFIGGAIEGISRCSSMEITLSPEEGTGTGKTKVIRVNSIGLIEVISPEQ